MSEKDIRLGDQVEDVTSGLKGIAIGREEFLNGAIYWIVQPPMDDRANSPKVEYIQDAYCRRIGDGVYVKPKPPAGFNARDLPHDKN